MSQGGIVSLHTTSVAPLEMYHIPSYIFCRGCHGHTVQRGEGSAHSGTHTLNEEVLHAMSAVTCYALVMVHDGVDTMCNIVRIVQCINGLGRGSWQQ